MIKAAALVFCFSASPCVAMTGAELLQTDSAFGAGYVFGVVEAETGVNRPHERNFTRNRTCLIEGKITSDTLYEVAMRYLRNNPKYLPYPAFGAVINAVNEMCGG